MLFDHGGPGGDFEELIVRQAPELGARIVVAIHSTKRGPAFGGIRRVDYETEQQALSDVLALAEAMSLKCALAGLPAGGAKTIVWPDPLLRFEKQPAYRAVGRIVKDLGGRYVCGPDLGTGTIELAEVRRQTRFVNPEPNDAGVSTAAGVEAGMRAIWSELGKSPGPDLTVAIQGLGAVGRNLARSLLEQKIDVIGSDLRPEAMAAAGAIGIKVVAPEDILRTPCDVLAPCAVGGTITEDVVPQLRCRAICGSANNQLATPKAAEALMRAGILHAPDVVVSAGAVTEGVFTMLEGDTQAVRDKIRAAIDAFEGTTRAILAVAAQRGMPPGVIARKRAQAMLED